MLIQDVIYVFHNLITDLNEVDVNCVESIYIYAKHA